MMTAQSERITKTEWIGMLPNDAECQINTTATTLDLFF